MANWIYTRAEKDAINAAYSAVAYIVDHTSGGASTLREALRYERRERKSATTAKALIVRGFMDGRKRNPRASELGYVSRGIILATILGADTRRGRYIPADTLRRFPKLAAAAAAAHDEYIHRGCLSCETPATV
jgi:hypothetical protein